MFPGEMHKGASPARELDRRAEGERGVEMSCGHVLGLVCCVGVVETALWTVSYALASMVDEGVYFHPAVSFLNGVLVLLTFPVWILYWLVGLVCLVVEGFRKGISSWKTRESGTNRQEGASEGF